MSFLFFRLGEQQQNEILERRQINANVNDNNNKVNNIMNA